MLRLLRVEHFPSVYVCANDEMPIADKNNVVFCQLRFEALATITGIIAWEDEDGRGFISLIDGLREDTFEDGPFYRLPLQWHHESDAFPTVSLEKWGIQINLFVYPVQYEAWCTP